MRKIQVLELRTSGANQHVVHMYIAGREKPRVVGASFENHPHMSLRAAHSAYQLDEHPCWCVRIVGSILWSVPRGIIGVGYPDKYDSLVRKINKATRERTEHRRGV